MFSLKSIVLVAAACVFGAEASGVAVPAALAAPLVAPAHVGYTHAVPQNIPPYAAQISVVNRAVAAPVAAAYAAPVAAPLAAPVATPLAAPVAPVAPFAARVAAPYFAGPAPAFAPAAYAAAPVGYAAAPAAYAAAPAAYAAAPAAYAAPYPYASYAAAAPLLRTPFGLAPTFVR